MCFAIKTNIIFDPQISVASFWFSKQWKHFCGPPNLVGTSEVSPGAPGHRPPILGHSGL